MLCSANNLGAAGWTAVVGALDGCFGLTSVGGVSCNGLFAGELVRIRITRADKGLANAIIPFLGRSASTLTLLDLRCVAFICLG